MAYASGRLSKAICARCNLKHDYRQLRGDRDRGPSLRVCSDDNDERDPWKLPARPADPIALQYPRPDVDIAVNPLGLISDDMDYFIITDDGSFYIKP